MSAKHRVQEWEAAGLISPEQAQAIRDHETTSRASGRTPLVAEALGYVGIVLAYVTALVILLESWEDLGSTAKLLVVGGPGVAFLVLGAYLRRMPTGAASRLASLSWTITVATAGLWTWLFLDLHHEMQEQTTLLVASATALVVALAGYLLMPLTLQQVVLAATVAQTIAAGLVFAGHEVWAVGLAVWALGVAWLALSWGAQLRPQTTGYWVGSLLVLYGPGLLIGGVWWGALFGALSALGLVGWGVAVRRLSQLALGCVGIFIYVPTTALQYASESGNDPAVLLGVASVVIVGAALTLARLGRKS